MIPCCYSCVLLNDPSLGRTLLNPQVWASGRQDELLGDGTQHSQKRQSSDSRSLLRVLLLDLLHNNTLEMGSAH